MCVLDVFVPKWDEHNVSCFERTDLSKLSYGQPSQNKNRQMCLKSLKDKQLIILVYIEKWKYI